MASWKYRLARALVGPLVLLPEGGDGAYVILVMDGGTGTATYKATKFRMKSRLRLQPLGSDTSYSLPRHLTTFVGTVER